VKQFSGWIGGDNELEHRRRRKDRTMRNLLAGLAALVILLGTLGWFRDWYTVGTLPAETGRFAFRVEVDGLKVGNDVVDVLHYVRDKASSKKDSDEDRSDKEPKAEEKASEQK
jgi:hypothetical protein